MGAQIGRLRRFLQSARLVGIVAPSLLIVAILIMFVGLGGWALLMDLRDPGDATAVVLLFTLSYLAVGAWLGSAFFRFCVRLMPVASDGRRRTAIITVLVLSLSLLLAPIFVFTQELVESFELLTSEKPLQPGGEFDFEALGETFSLFGVIYGSWLIATLGIPLLLLLHRHLNPTSWRCFPYLLFLRRFSGLSNAIGIGPLLRGVKGETRVVFLVGPRNNPRIWNPFTMAFSGIRLIKPWSNVPVCLQSTEESWQDDIEAFARDAEAIVIDITDDSRSMQFECDVAAGAPRPESVLWLYDHSGDVDDVPNAGTQVSYRTSYWAAVPAAIVMFVLAGYVTLGVVGLLPFVPLKPEDGTLVRLAYAAIWFGIPLAAGLGFASRYAWHARLTRRSGRQIRAAVGRLFDVP